MSTVKAIPAGYRTVTPYLTIKNGAKALEFYKKAFGATEIYKLMMPDGRLGHAEIRLGDSMIMLGDEFPEYGGKAPDTLGGSPVSIYLYVEDVDAFFKRAPAASSRIRLDISGGWPRIKKTLRRRRYRNARRRCSRRKSKSVYSRTKLQRRQRDRGDHR